MTPRTSRALPAVTAFLLLSSFAAAQTNLLVNPRFETAAAVDGVPAAFGIWGADQSAIVAAENGVTPMVGPQMLKFVHTSPGNTTEGSGGDVLQLVDLAGFSSPIAAGTARFRLSANFNRIAGDATTDTRFEVKIAAYAGLPAAFSEALAPLGTSTAFLIADANTGTWQALATDLVMPAGTTYAAVWVSAIENVQNDSHADIEFAGHYADAVAFALIPAGGSRSLANLSANLDNSAGGASTVAASFSIEGAGSKTVLLRAVGPTLAGAPHNVTGMMSDPVLNVFNGFAVKSGENDNWGSAAGSPAIAAAATAAGAFALADHSKDAAMVLTLGAGTYTARVDGTSGSTGKVLIEVYDTDANSRFTYFNLNHRISAGGTNVAGFVVAGTTAQTVLVRALGPALAGAGVPGTLPNPILTLFSGANSLAGNDNWGNGTANADLAAAAATAGLRPLADGSNDAALLVTLAPGSYTVQIAGNGGAGVTQLEVAAIDADRAATIAPALLGPVPAAAAGNGSILNYSAVAIGKPAPAFQWRKNGTDIANATNAGLNLANSAAADAANYSVAISNSAGGIFAQAGSGTVWNLANPSTHTGAFFGVAHSDSVYAAVGDSGLIFTSTDGLSWNRITPASGSQLRAIAGGGGRFVAVGVNGAIRYSTDLGATWLFGTSPTASQFNGVIHDGTRFVAVGANSSVYWSTDGLAWTAGDLGTAAKSLNAVAFKSGGNYVAVAGDGSIFSTADVTGGTWTAATSNTANSLNAVSFVNNLFVAVGAAGTIRTSSTGAGNWTSVTSPTSAQLNAVTQGGGTFVAVGGNTLLTSSDATTWSSAGILPLGNAAANGIVFAGDRFVAVGFPGSIVTSTTGAANTWVHRTAMTTLNFNDVTYGNGRFVAVGHSGGIVTTPDGTAPFLVAPALAVLSNTTLRRVAYGAGTFVAVGDNGTLLSSSDGAMWANRSLGTANYFAVVWGGGRFVAAGGGGAFATSPNGIDWTAGAGGIGGSGNVTGLAYGGATPVYVAVNTLGGIFTSADAIAWAAQASPTANQLNSVRFVGGQFVAVGAASTFLASPDGAAWTSRGIGLAGINLSDVGHGGGLNVLVHTTGGGTNGVIFVSYDHVVWTAASLGGPNGTPINLFAQSGIAYGNGAFFIAANNGILARTLPNTGNSRIVTQPANQTLAAGGSATLGVTTNGVAGIAYQWFKGASGDTSTLLAGETNASLTVNVSGRYWVRLTGGGPTIFSATAAVTGTAPTITTQPVALGLTVGQGGTLAVTATGAGPLTYQWRKFGSPVAGATDASFALSNATLVDAGYYDVVVNDGLAAVTSRAARVDVNPAAASYGTVLRPRASTPRFEVNNANLLAFAFDPADGNKVYAAGEFTRIDGALRLGVARFHADGSFDSSWTPAALVGGGSVRALLVEGDGVIVAGDFTLAGGVARGRIAKLSKSTGALDPTFAAGTGANGPVHALVRQIVEDGAVRYLVGGGFSAYDGTTVNRLVRLDATGTRDPSFTLAGPGGTGFGHDVRALVVDGTGTAAKIYAGGLFTSHHGVTTNRNRLVRLDHTGAYDATFDIGSGFGGDVSTLALMGAGATAKLHVGGRFTSFNGTTANRSRIARLDATGAYDTAFAVGSGFGSDVLSLALDSAGNVYVGGSFTSFNGTTSNVNRIVRLTAAGARDPAFNNGGTGAPDVVSALLLRETDNRLLLGGAFATYNGSTRGGLARVSTADGAVDPVPAHDFRRPGGVLAIEPAPGGKWYVAGGFTHVDDAPRSRFARLNGDGTLDTGFVLPAGGFGGIVNALAVQGDGRILAAGSFGNYAGVSRSNILRLHPDATLDVSFNPGTGFGGAVSGLALLPDGRIAAAGSFTTVNGVTRNRIARLRSDGSLDHSFDPVAGFTANVNAPAPLAVQSDGKLVVGGTFATYNGTTANGIVRILETGLVDSTFNPGGAGFAGSTDVRALTARLDDRLVAGGAFTSYNGTTRNRLNWLTSAGASAAAFVTATGVTSTLTALHVQPDDRTIVAGFFNTAVGVSRNGFARLNASGTLDPAFVVPTAFVPVTGINVVRPMPDGALVVGALRLDFQEFPGRGSVTILEPAPVPAIATPPGSVAASLGGTVSFGVSATGENLSYRWSRDGVPIAGGTDPTLTLDHLSVADAGGYTVVVSNLYGTVSSAPAFLSGTGAAPVIAAQPVAASAAPGGSVTLSVTAGGGTLAYQWRKFGVPIAGATGASLRLDGLAAVHAGYYDVLVGNGLSVTVSHGAAVAVAPAPAAVALQPRASFEPRVERVGIVTKFAPLDDGRFYAAGSFTTIDGVASPGIARFLQNGDRDPSFTPALVNGAVNHIAVQADDKVVIAGTFVHVAGVNQFRLARLNADGSLDTSFAVKVGSGVSGGAIAAIALQPADRKILIAGAFTSVNGYAANRILRLEPDGSPDPSFTIGTGFDNPVNAFILQPDTKIVAVGNFTSFNGATATRIARLTAAGALDATFVTGTGFEFGPAALALQPADNKIVVVGSFINYNGVTSNGIVRLDSTGAREAGFPAGSGFSGLNNNTGPLNVLVQANGALVVGGNFTGYNGTATARLVRLDGTTGAIDPALGATLGTAGLNSTVRHAAIQAVTGQLLVGGPIAFVNTTARSGLVRFNADGTLDALNRLFREPGQVLALQPVSGNKYVIGGNFSHIGGTPVTNLARVDAAGALDATFHPGTGPNAAVRAIARQGDGSLVIGGNFSAYNGTMANRIARVSADGALDLSFVAATGSGFNNQINALALQPDGRIVAAGNLTQLNGVPVNRIARLDPGGMPDTAFTANNGTGFNTNTGGINAVVVQPDGRIVVGGVFVTFNGASVKGIARLHENGGLDSSFAVGTGLALGGTQSGTPSVNTLLLQSDGKVVAGGFFGAYNGSQHFNLVRLLPDGAPDFSFATGGGFNNLVNSLALQRDGAIVVGGFFSQFNGIRRGGLLRLTPYGGLDPAFGVGFAQGSPSTAIATLQFAADGSLLAGTNGRIDFQSRATGGLLQLEPVPSLPVILTQPFGGAFLAGSTTNVLGVTAAAGPNATYEWKRNGAAIPGSAFGIGGVDRDVLDFNHAQAGDAGIYTVTIADGASSVTSDPVVVSIIAAPPAVGAGVYGTFGSIMQAGTAAYAGATATGSAPIAAQWQKNGTPVSGGFHNLGTFYYPLSPLQPADAAAYGVTLTNSLGNTAAPTTRLHVVEETGWRWHSPQPGANALTVVEVIDGQFVAGGLRGSRIGSPDGIAWTQLPALSHNNVIGLMAGNGRRVIAGSLGFTAVSPDGHSWHSGSLGSLQPVQGAAFGAGVFVIATGSSGSSTNSGKIYSSPDGVVWTERVNRTTGGHGTVAFGNGVFAVLTGGETLMRSAGGIAWNEVAPPFLVTNVRFAHNLFFATGTDGRLYTSPDALTWTQRAFLGFVLGDVEFGGGTYVLTGGGGRLFTSADLTTWTPRASGTLASLRGIAHHNGTWVVIGNQTIPNVVLTSTDNGVTWSNRVTGLTPLRLESAATDGSNSMIAVGDNGYIVRTTDGNAWTPVTSGVSENLKGAVFASGKYVVTGLGGRILTSANGTSWTTAVSGTTNDLFSLSFANGRFFATGANKVFLASADGATGWAAVSVPGTPQLNGEVAYAAGLFVVGGDGGAIFTSPDGTTWTARASGTTEHIGNVVSDGSLFVASTEVGTHLTSSDGLEWTLRPALFGSDGGVVYVGARFLTGSDSNIGYLSSVDGLSWTPHQTGSQGSLNGVALFNGRIYGVGDAGHVISTALAPTILQQPLPATVVAGAPARLNVLAADTPLGVAYQWRKDGAPISGATNATLSLASVQSADLGSYDVVLGNSSGSVTSAAVSLSHVAAPAILAQPASAAVPVGGTLTLQVTVAGSFPFTWQWRKDNVAIDGATSAFYAKHNFTAGDAGSYDVVIANAAGNVTSDAVAVALAPAAGTFASDPGFTRPDFKADALAGRVTIDAAGRVYATWTNGNVLSGIGHQHRGAVIRLNPDGTLDPAFSIGAALVDAWAIALQPDGRILVGGIAGNETGETGYAMPRVFRFNADGTRDFSYFSPHFAAMPRFMTLQPDGKLLVVPANTGGRNGGFAQMVRLDPDGSFDSTFTPPAFNDTAFVFAPPVVAGDGRIYIGGTFNTVNAEARAGVARLHGNGSVDAAFVPSGYSLGGGVQIRGLVLQTQGANAGKLLVAGGPIAVAGSAAPATNRPVIRLLASGGIDAGFSLATYADAGVSTAPGGRPRLLKLLPDDRFYIVSSSVARFLPDGAIDGSYTKPAFSTEFFWMDTMADGRVVVAPELGATVNDTPAPTLVRLTAGGAVDGTFSPGVFNREVYPGRFAVVADSRLLAWGPFDRANGIARPGIARFNVNGSLDPTFNVTGVANLRFVAFAEVGADGRILAGTRTGTGPTALAGGVVRLNADGSVDNSFTLDASLAGGANGMEFRLLPDHKVAVWSLSPQGLVSDSNFLRRLGPNGPIDPTFVPGDIGEFGAVYRGTSGAITSITMGAFRVIAHDPAGRLIARGTTGSYPANATALDYTLLRLNANGALDTTFAAPVVSWPTSGSFPTVTDAPTNGGAAGPVPASIVSGTPFAGAVPLPDGKLLVYGLFTSLGGRPAPGIARLTATGAVDPAFNIGTGAQLRYQAARTAQVEGVSVAADGRLWVTGAFDTFNGFAAPGIVRLDSDGTVDPAFATGIFHRTYLGGLAQVGFAPNGTVYVSGTYSRPGDTFPAAFQALVNAGVPVIATPPVAAQAVAAGAAVTFSVAANGAAPLTYQWRKDGTDLPGATGSSYTIASVAAGDAGGYDVVVTGSGGTVVSAPSVLSVNPSIAILDQPASRRAVAGSRVLWRVAASTTTAGATLTYQWRKDGASLPGATAADLVLPAALAADAGSYSVVVGDGVNTATSGPALLTILPAAPILWESFTESSIEQSPARTIHDGAGKLYVPWSVYDRNPDLAGGKLAGALVRLNEGDGSPDPAFRLDRRIRRATHAAIDTNGRMLVAVTMGDTDTVVRVSNTGAIDHTFNAPFFARGIRFIARQPDGKVLVAAVNLVDPHAPAGSLAGAAPGIYRLNADGSPDAGFTPAVLDPFGVIFGDLVLDANGRIYLAGAFTSVGGTARAGLARLDAGGTLDSAFADPANSASLPDGFVTSQARGVALQSDGQAVFVGGFRYPGHGTPADQIMAIRFSAAGGFDSAFAQPLRSQLGLGANGIRLRYLSIQSDNRIVAVSDRLLRLSAGGAPDSGFVSRAFGKEAFWLSRDAAGRFFVPDLDSVAGQAVSLPLVGNGIGVFAADGTPDPSFQTGGWGRSATVETGVVLAGGRVWVGGQFNRFGSTYAPGIAQFSPQGALSVTQAAFAGSMNFGVVAAAGGDRVFALHGTSFNTAETPVRSLVRLGVDAVRDPSFNPVLPSGYPLESATVAASPGGKLLLVQERVTVQDALAGATGAALIRLNSDGTRDTGYNATVASFASVERGAGNAVAMIRTGGAGVGQVLPDGRALIAVAAVDGNLRLQRLLESGAVDTSFTAPSFGAITPVVGFTNTLTDPVTNTTAQFPVSTYAAGAVLRAVHQAADGRVYVGGRFALAGAPHGLVRLGAGGALDPTFTGSGVGNSGAGALPFVAAIVSDSSGRIYVAGRFDSFNGIAVPAGIFRLRPDGTFDESWFPPFRVVDAPTAQVRLVVVGGRLYAFGTVAVSEDALPLPYVSADIPPAPTVTSPPASTVVALDGSVTFSVAAGGAGPLTYQWFKGGEALVNGGAISGATGPNLIIDPVGSASAGSYTVAITGPGGTTVTAPVTLGIGAGLGISVQPQPLTVSEGAAFSLGVGVSGAGPFTYQWRRDGVGLATGTGAVYGVAAAALTDAGVYSVVVNAGGESVTSGPALVVVVPAGLAADHQVAGGGYAAGGTVTVGSTLTYVGTAAALGWQVLLPPGWSFAGDAGAAANTRPAVGQSELLEWAWTDSPASPVAFSYTLNVPAGQAGDRHLAAIGIIRLQGGVSAFQLLARPDPLVVRQALNHDTDTDRNFRISLTELTRAIELYNTRNGTTRTGAYRVEPGTEDGYNVDPSRSGTAVVSLARYHSADPNRDGRLSLFELTRVIELYNFRVGTTRTGQYRILAGTEDGFAPGP